MKKLLLGSALALALISGAQAQNITKSLQGSQDPRGPVGLDASNNAYFPAHILSFGQAGGGAGPTASNCTGPCGAVSGTDVAGTVLTSGTTVNITFGQAFGAVPFCLMQEVNGATAPTYTAYTTGIIAGTVVTAKNYNWVCLGQQ